MRDGCMAVDDKSSDFTHLLLSRSVAYKPSEKVGGVRCVYMRLRCFYKAYGVMGMHTRMSDWLRLLQLN